MTTKKAKYDRVYVTADDLREALMWLEGSAADASFTIRLVRPKQGEPYLAIGLSGYRRIGRIGSPARQTAEARFPSVKHGSLLSCMYGLVYTLADQCEDPEEAPNGRFTELVPDWRPKVK